jgi:hypothetical protein
VGGERQPRTHRAVLPGTLGEFSGWLLQLLFPSHPADSRAAPSSVQLCVLRHVCSHSVYLAGLSFLCLGTSGSWVQFEHHLHAPLPACLLPWLSGVGALALPWNSLCPLLNRPHIWTPPPAASWKEGRRLAGVSGQTWLSRGIQGSLFEAVVKVVSPGLFLPA